MGVLPRSPLFPLAAVFVQCLLVWGSCHLAWYPAIPRRPFGPDLVVPLRSSPAPLLLFSRALFPPHGRLFVWWPLSRLSATTPPTRPFTVAWPYSRCPPHPATATAAATPLLGPPVRPGPARGAPALATATAAATPLLGPPVNSARCFSFSFLAAQLRTSTPVARARISPHSRNPSLPRTSLFDARPVRAPPPSRPPPRRRRRRRRPSPWGSPSTSRRTRASSVPGPRSWRGSPASASRLTTWATPAASAAAVRRAELRQTGLR